MSDAEASSPSAGVEPRTELVGRQPQLRQALDLLRADAGPGAAGGVVLTGIGGIGKTALAGQIVRRLREDATQPWAVAGHVGRFNPEHLFAAIATALPDPQARQLTEPGVPDRTKLEVVTQLLRDRRLLLVFDGFEPNLTDEGGAFRNRAVADVFAAFCAAAKRGKLLVTCRHPVPRAGNLVTIVVPPLSRGEVGQLLLRLPALRDLPGDDLETIVDTIGGHPRLLELADALVRAPAGRARMTEVAAQLRERAGQENAAIDGHSGAAPDTEPGAAEAAEAVLLGCRDVLVSHLVDLLTEAQRQTLLQAAMSRMPLPVADLHYAVNPDAEPGSVHPEPTDVDELVDLTLLTRGDRGLFVDAWVRAALAPDHGDDRPRRRERAIALHRRRIEENRATFDDFTELARHLTALQQFDELAYFPLSVCEKTVGELGVAILLGDLLATFPRDHPSIHALLYREIDALTNLGNNDAAAQRDQELLSIMRRGLEPDDVRRRPDLGVAYERLGDLVQAPALATSARDLLNQATTFAVQMAQADPGDMEALTSSYATMGDLAAKAGNIAGARQMYHQAVTIARRLAEVDPGNVQLHRNLATYVGKLGLLEATHGDPATALQHLHEGQAIVAKLAALDPTSAQPYAEAFEQLIVELRGAPASDPAAEGRDPADSSAQPESAPPG